MCGNSLYHNNIDASTNNKNNNNSGYNDNNNNVVNYNFTEYDILATVALRVKTQQHFGNNSFPKHNDL